MSPTTSFGLAQVRDTPHVMTLPWIPTPPLSTSSPHYPSNHTLTPRSQRPAAADYPPGCLLGNPSWYDLHALKLGASSDVLQPHYAAVLTPFSLRVLVLIDVSNVHPHPSPHCLHLATNTLCRTTPALHMFVHLMFIHFRVSVHHLGPSPCGIKVPFC